MYRFMETQGQSNGWRREEMAGFSRTSAQFRDGLQVRIGGEKLKQARANAQLPIGNCFIHGLHQYLVSYPSGMVPTAEAFEPAYSRRMGKYFSKTSSQAQCEDAQAGVQAERPLPRFLT